MKRTDHQIIQQVLDGAVSRESFDRFQKRMRDEPELTKFYGEYALLHHTLAEEFEDREVSDRMLPTVKQTFSARIALTAVAAVIVIATGIFFYGKLSHVTPSEPIMGTARFSADAVWEIEGGGKQKGDSADLTVGAVLKLARGRAAVATGPATRALITGPASLMFVSEGVLHLAEGSGRFRMAKPGDKLEVSTPTMTAVDLGTEFALDVRPSHADELHVFDGKVQLRINGNSDGEILTKGQAGRVSGSSGIERFTADSVRFPTELGGFQQILGGPFVKTEWRRDYGSSSIAEDRIDGENFSIFKKLPTLSPDDTEQVLLATLEVARPLGGEFHTHGWAGMSFFNQGKELLFFGDSFGPERTWSLDVKQHVPVILPVMPVLGPRSVTLRYDRKSGEVSLHEGNIPLGPAFCSGSLPAGTSFDEIRLGASSGAALAVRSLTIQTGGNAQ